MELTEKQIEFQKGLAHAINYSSMENGSNTPDFILAAFLADCLKAFNRATAWKTMWHSPDGVPEGLRDCGPTEMESPAACPVAPAPASTAIPKQECGHSVAHEVRAAENGELLYCDICNTRSELRDALQMEAHYKAQLVKARNKDLQVALLASRLAQYCAGDAPKKETLEQRIANHLRKTYGDHGTCDDTVAREIAELAKEQP